MFDLRVEVDAELGLDGGDYTFLQSYDLFRIGLAGIVDDDQRLLFPYGSASAALSLPSALLYHPCRRDLYHRRGDCHVALLLAMT